MRTAKIAVCLSALALAPTLSAQSHDPVPTRIRTQTFAAPAGVAEPTELGIKLDCTGYDQAAVQVFGGTAHNLAVWLIGARPTELPFLGALILVEPNLAVAVSEFDTQGRAALAVPLERKEFIGQDIYVQGLELGTVSGEPDKFASSESMRLRWYPGCVQPPLAYTGPEFTGILVHELGKENETPEYALYASIQTMVPGYQLVAERIYNDPGVTSVYLRLYEPPTVSVNTPYIDQHRCLIPIGQQPEKQIAVYIAQVAPDGQWLLFDLAAVIQRDF